MKEEKVEYKDLKIKEIVERINKSLDQVKNDFSDLVSLISKEEKKESKIPEGYIAYNFEIPIPKLSRLEYWLIGKINKESTKHQIQYILNRDREERIIQIFIKKDQQNEEHLNHIIKCCKWVSKTLEENAKKESQENKNIPSDLL